MSSKIYKENGKNRKTNKDHTSAKTGKKLPLIVGICVGTVLVIAAFICIWNFSTHSSGNSEEKVTEDGLLKGTLDAEIKVKDYGTISLELDADTAPITVTNFVNLAKDGFYDGLTFHRIMDGFMIQGGDPLGNGTGGSENQIKGEFSSNGVENNISHVRGVISMARAQNPDSASSQFFIVQSDSTFLDGQYAGFGKVTSGMEIVDQICKDVTPTDNNGTIVKEDQPIIESIRILDEE